MKPGLLCIGFNRSRNRCNNSAIDVRGKILIDGLGCHSFGAGCFITVENNATFEIGNNFACTGDTIINVKKSIVIGDDNMWSYSCVVMDNDGHSIYDNCMHLVNLPKPVVFGRHVWLGCNSTVLKGVMIHDNIIIASNSIITKDCIEGYSIVASNRILKKGVTWKG